MGERSGMDGGPADLVAGFDHAIVAVGTHLAPAAERYGLLGFTLTPVSVNAALGTSNHLIVLGRDYIELMARPGPEAPADGGAAAPPGVIALALAVDDVPAFQAAAAAAGIAAQAPLNFTRPITLPTGEREASFEISRLPREALAGIRLIGVRHRNPELIWRGAWQEHANGATAIREIVLAADRPQAAEARFGALLGQDQVARLSDGGLALTIGHVRVTLLPPDVLMRDYGEDESVRSILVLECRDVMRTRLELEANAVPAVPTMHGLHVRASAAMGHALVFVGATASASPM